MSNPEQPTPEISDDTFDWPSTLQSRWEQVSRALDDIADLKHQTPSERQTIGSPSLHESLIRLSNASSAIGVFGNVVHRISHKIAAGEELNDREASLVQFLMERDPRQVDDSTL